MIIFFSFLRIWIDDKSTCFTEDAWNQQTIQPMENVFCNDLKSQPVIYIQTKSAFMTVHSVDKHVRNLVY